MWRSFGLPSNTHALTLVGFERLQRVCCCIALAGLVMMVPVVYPTHRLDVEVVMKAPTVRRRTLLPSCFENLEDRLNLTCLLEAGDGEYGAAVRATNCYAADLHSELTSSDDNVFFSPVSVSTALAMTYAGAAGNTAAEMEEVLHFDPDPSFHQSFAALVASLQTPSPGYELRFANAQWPHIEFAFKEEYIDQISNDYRGYVQTLDYAEDPVGARDTINQWVEQQTEGNIENLLASLSPLTRMVLTNALYFNTRWLNSFNKTEGTFTKADGTTTQIPMFTTANVFHFTEIGGFKVLSLPNAGLEEDEFGFGFPVQARTSTVFIIPTEGTSAGDIDAETYRDIQNWLGSRRKEVASATVLLPAVDTTVPTNLKQVLKDQGIVDMFDPFKSDFSSMTDASEFHIMQALHKASLKMDEDGIEASAATAVVGGIICFAENTPVRTQDGFKMIQDIEAGDLVLSRSEYELDSRVEMKEVLETFKNRAEIVHVHVGSQIIRTTAEHPFYVKDRGWVPANELQPGDSLAADLASWTECTKVEFTGECEAVYNFRVADYHTYFVGNDDWGFSVWTHNCCCDPEIEIKVDRPFHMMIRDDTTSAVLFMGRINDPQAGEIEPSGSTSQDPIPGDANTDGVVDFSDFLIVADNFGKNEDVAFADGDFNGDGMVSFADFLLLSQNFGESA